MPPISNPTDSNVQELQDLPEMKGLQEKYSNASDCKKVQEALQEDARSPGQDSLWKPTAERIRAWLPLHHGESFTLDEICRQNDIGSAAARNIVTQVLARLVKRAYLQKSCISGKTLYRYIDNTLVTMDPFKDITKSNDIFVLWPEGRDGTHFDFTDCVFIPRGGLIVIAGVTNTGKSALARNFLWQNMDAHTCTYFSTETSAGDFAEYGSRMTWADPYRDGKLKFEFAPPDTRFLDPYHFKDVLRPKSINIVDWLNVPDELWKIGGILQGMKDTITDGILVVLIQKDPRKEFGAGGMWGEHLASLYLTLDFGRVTVKKAKKWHDRNPNGHSWAFDIRDAGAHFYGIHEVKKCPTCYDGKYRGQECGICRGTGWIDA